MAYATKLCCRSASCISYQDGDGVWEPQLWEGFHCMLSNFTTKCNLVHLLTTRGTATGGP